MKALHLLLALVVVFAIAALGNVALGLAPQPGTAYFESDFDEPLPASVDLGEAVLHEEGQGHEEAGRGRVLHVRAAAGGPGRVAATIPLDVGPMRGNSVWVGADVRGQGVSRKPNHWNGVKVMLVIQTPSGTLYPQPDVPVGTFGWGRFAAVANVPADATAAHLVLGLEEVTGEVWFDNVSVKQRRSLARAPAADPQQPVYKGHDLPRLRGAMAGHRLTEADVRHFAEAWNGNVLRWQLTEVSQTPRPLETYDAWLEEELKYLDRVLAWCREYGVLVVVDLHSPPGGYVARGGGYISSYGLIFQDPTAQAMFIDTWRKIAERYKGNDVIWGYDLMNEPNDTMLGEGALDWNQLAQKAAEAIRQIEPDRTLIVEFAYGASGVEHFRPLTVPRCVYSVHVYDPLNFTHQNVPGVTSATGVHWPGEVDGKHWDKAVLREALQPYVDFAERYRVHMYVGEFGAIRTAPGDSAARYLADAIAIFEDLGWDWTFHAYREWHGWSVEHAGPMNAPRPAEEPTARQRVITEAFSANRRPEWAR